MAFLFLMWDLVSLQGPRASTRSRESVEVGMVGTSHPCRTSSSQPGPGSPSRSGWLGPRIPAGTSSSQPGPGSPSRSGWLGPRIPAGTSSIDQVPGVRRGWDGWDLASLQGPRAVYVIESFIIFADMYVCR